MSDEALVLRVVRGDEPVSALETLGIKFEGRPPSMRMTVPILEAIDVSLSDLSHGLLSAWARRTDLAEWSFVMLGADFIVFAHEDAEDWEMLLGALRSAAAGEPVSESALNLARLLAV